MDAYLSEEARQQLRAQALEIPHRRAAGLLLGHRRGGRFFVERIYPCLFGPLSSAQRYVELDVIFEGKIIGFYSSGRRGGAAGEKWPPFSYNKLYLELELHPKRGLILRPSVVEYSDSFRLVPAVLAARPEKKR